MAALADAAGTSTPFAGVLDNRGGAVVVLRKSFAEIHVTDLCAVRMLKAGRHYRWLIKAVAADCGKIDVNESTAVARMGASGSGRKWPAPSQAQRNAGSVVPLDRRIPDFAARGKRFVWL